MHLKRPDEEPHVNSLIREHHHLGPRGDCGQFLRSDFVLDEYRQAQARLADRACRVGGHSPQHHLHMLPILITPRFLVQPTVTRGSQLASRMHGLNHSPLTGNSLARRLRRDCAYEHSRSLQPIRQHPSPRGRRHRDQAHPPQCASQYQDRFRACVAAGCHTVDSGTRARRPVHRSGRSEPSPGPSSKERPRGWLASTLLLATRAGSLKDPFSGSSETDTADQTRSSTKYGRPLDTAWIMLRHVALTCCAIRSRWTSLRGQTTLGTGRMLLAVSSFGRIHPRCQDIHIENTPAEPAVYNASGQLEPNPHDHHTMTQSDEPIVRTEEHTKPQTPTGLNSTDRPSKFARKTFIDLFAGCGGLSLGLLNAGWDGLFAIEKHPDAFRTLRHNLIERNEHNHALRPFRWPVWLAKDPIPIESFIKDHLQALLMHKGSIDLIVGGPPCQGFSLAGQRRESDPRNTLGDHQLTLIDILRPKLVLLENVRGIDIPFYDKTCEQPDRSCRQTFASRFSASLKGLGYDVNTDLICASQYGVPQKRRRCFILGVRLDIADSLQEPNLFHALRSYRNTFLSARGLPENQPTTAADAISDLQTIGQRLTQCRDGYSPPGYSELEYSGPKTIYQALMHRNAGTNLNSLRLVKHRPETVEKFSEILLTCRKGCHLSTSDRHRLGINKHAITPVDPEQPAPTITTLPDDLIHYCEPRIHTVREHARLQSFPDWFEFQGRYTTGGNRRRDDCPRYTQVGNAVPPLLAEAFGEVLATTLDRIET